MRTINSSEAVITRRWSGPYGDLAALEAVRLVYSVWRRSAAQTPRAFIIYGNPIAGSPAQYCAFAMSRALLLSPTGTRRFVITE